MARDYKKEYRLYHSKPEQRKRRAEHNRARREEGLRIGDPRVVSFIKPLSQGGYNKPCNRTVHKKGTKSQNRKPGCKNKAGK